MDDNQQKSAAYEQAREREHHLETLRREKAIRETFEGHPVKFRIPPDQVMQALGSVEYKDGVVYAGGVTLEAAITNYSVVNPVAIADKTVEEHDQGASSIKAKDQLKDAKAKSDYISAHGYDSFARLPATVAETQQVPADQLNWEQYKALPLRERARLAGERPGLAAQLQRKAQEQDRYDRLTGVPVGKRR